MINISIIMPVYNTAMYLGKSIGSLLKQTYGYFELICVNDASSDASLAVLEEFKGQDSRIVIINHENNYGAAASRNDGLKIAKGEYVIFLDSDDFFYRDNMLEELYKYASDNCADIVLYGSEYTDKTSTQKKKIAYQFEIIDSLEKKAFFLPKMRHAPWDKLVRRRILLENNICFQNILTNNDIFFSYATVMSAKKMVVCDQVLAEYGDFQKGRAGSLTTLRFSRFNYTVEAFYAVYTFCNRQNIERYLKTVFMNILLDNIQMYLSEKMYSVEMRHSSLNHLLEYSDLMNELKVRLSDNSLYPHNEDFAKKLVDGGDVCSMEYMQYYANGLENIILRTKSQNKKTALWGCGHNGKRLIDVMQTHNLVIDYVVDENKELQGKSYGKYIIYPYDDVSEDIDIIWITNLAFKDVIEERAVGKEVIYVWQ